MFQSRVVVLGLCVVVVNVVLLLQLVRLAVVDGSRHAVLAESRLHEQSWLPTWRGSILDRSGRVLAHDEPAYDVAFSYDAITGAWIRQQAVRAARRAAGAAAWSAASPSQREQLIAGERRVVQRELEAFWEDVETSASLEPGELDERRNDVLATVQHMAAVVWEQQRRRHEARYSGEEHGPTFRPRPIAEQEAFHVLLPAVDVDPSSAESHRWRLLRMRRRLRRLAQENARLHAQFEVARHQWEVEREQLKKKITSAIELVTATHNR